MKREKISRSSNMDLTRIKRVVRSVGQARGVSLIPSITARRALGNNVVTIYRENNISNYQPLKDDINVGVMTDVEFGMVKGYVMCYCELHKIKVFTSDCDMKFFFGKRNREYILSPIRRNKGIEFTKYAKEEKEYFAPRIIDKTYGDELSVREKKLIEIAIKKSKEKELEGSEKIIYNGKNIEESSTEKGYSPEFKNFEYYCNNAYGMNKGLINEQNKEVLKDKWDYNIKNIIENFRKEPKIGDDSKLFNIGLSIVLCCSMYQSFSYKGMTFYTIKLMRRNVKLLEAAATDKVMAIKLAVIGLINMCVRPNSEDKVFDLVDFIRLPRYPNALGEFTRVYQLNYGSPLFSKEVLGTGYYSEIKMGELTLGYYGVGRKASRERVSRAGLNYFNIMCS